MHLANTGMRIFLILLLINSATYAYTYRDYKDEIGRSVCCPQPSNPSRKIIPDGFYIGGQIGYDSLWVRENIALPPPADLTGNPKINAPGWVGGGLIGVGHYFCNAFYLGVEGFANYSKANESYFLTDAVGTYSSKIDARWSYGVALLPGFGIADSLLAYVRLGYNWGSFQAKESFDGFATSRTTTVSGPNYGLGMEALIVDQWTLRAEYTHTNYTSFSTAFGTNFDPSDNQVMVAIIYHFDLPCRKCC